MKKMMETIKLLNPLNISIFLPVLQGLHSKIRAIRGCYEKQGVQPNQKGVKVEHVGVIWDKLGGVWDKLSDAPIPPKPRYWQKNKDLCFITMFLRRVCRLSRSCNFAIIGRFGRKVRTVGDLAGKMKKEVIRTCFPADSGSTAERSVLKL